MIKRIGRRFVSLLLTFVTILTLLPAMTLPALAETKGTVTGLADENIGLSFTGTADNAWSASGTQIIGKARSTSGSGCGGGSDYRSTLTITNKKTTKATLSFDYTVVVSEGTILVNNTTTTADGSFSEELAAGGTVEVEINSGSTSADTKITMTNVKLVADVSATVTFQPSENGSYTVDGKTITEVYTHTQSSITAYQVKATPADDYRFMGWYDVASGKCISTDAKTALNFDSNRTITARFASKTAAFFETGGQVFDDLNEAIAEAQKNLPAIITLAESGKITGNYTIPSKVTLLIPFDEAKTCYTSTPTAITSTPPAKPFRTLTMAADSSLTLASGAAISVGGQYYAASGGKKGQMVGPYGYIKMDSGSAITVQSGASLYAWGFISGSGSVTVESSGSVYEWYQILDFRGGSASSNMGNKVFPFNQYTVQNIEVPMTLYAGASEMACSAIDAAGGIKLSSIPFIGTKSKGLFRLISGTLTKAYDGSTDRMIYTIDGVAELSNLSLKLSFVSINSESYVLPLTNNMTIDLNSGSKLTVNQTAALLPGVEVSIARNAELAVASGKSMYIYDMAHWGQYCGHGEGSTFIPVVNAPGKKYNRTDNDLVDVKVDVNGKLTAIGGIYTTAGGADICSSEGTGKYLQQGAPGKETTTYQYDGGTNRHDIPITAAKLKNADGSYTETKDAKAGKTFTYCTCKECNGKWEQNAAAIIKNDGTRVNAYKTLKEAVEHLEDGQYIKMLHSTTENINTENSTTGKNLYLDLNGCTVKGDITVKSGYKLYGMDSSANKDYVTAPSGKIVGKVTNYATTCQSPTVKVKDVDTYDRYVAIQVTEGTTSTLSFHHFNISVTGYRFELAAPECALFFIGKFQGDKAAKDYLTSLGFTLTDNIDGTTSKTVSCEMPKSLKDGAEDENSTVISKDGAYLFEAYLKKEIDKNKPDTYTKQFSATAKATFGSSGDPKDNSLSSEERKLSFQQALWDALSAPDMEEKDRKILMNFLNDMNIPNPNP